MKKKKLEADNALAAENEAVKTVNTAIENMRKSINSIKEIYAKLNNDRKDKELRTDAENACNEALSIISDENYANTVKSLEPKDKHKILVKEATDLEKILENEVERLSTLVATVKKENSFAGKVSTFFKDLMAE